MTPQQILIVAVRVFAIFWLLISIDHLVTAIRTWRELAPDPYAALALFFPIFELVACVFLWLFPATLSRRLLKGDDAQSEAPAPALKEWQAMLIVALGLYVLAIAIPDAVYWMTYVVIYPKSDVPLHIALIDQWPYIVATVVELAIGGWLLLGAPRLAVLLSRLRALGLRESTHEQ